MDNTNDKNKLGVIIGRYQIDALHLGHIECIREVANRHSRTLILIGDRDTPATDTIPLPAFVRHAMLAQHFPDTPIIPVMDDSSDEVWSQNVDAIVRSMAGPTGAILYSGREGFIPHYSGRYETLQLEIGKDHISASERRQDIAARPYIHDQKFRAGMIYQMQHLIPRTYETVDVAMLRLNSEKKVEVLLARKPRTKKWRFPGGHVETTETTLQAARREMHEETSLSLESDPKLIGEFLVKDWRVRDTSKAVYRTFMYAGWFTWGTAIAADDIEEVKWFDVNVLTVSPTCLQVVPEHQTLLYEGLMGYLKSPSGLIDIQFAQNGI